ncbi:unnamed protein product [Rotaria sp. Silwood1]|nr:unnamed protein product [Rotaria sp. Silwood1]CAF1626196.1 unnamed protein product [Rotaria sp. Silwood1]CAF3749115.1 unnamed protein product [Rotaria sp. Silwood1]CAF3768052.1 unnamed protein product [Rotaria sp. Silwood1]CAF3792450.1 unnamed protein product [Rotaria sp. Silwood1]
MSAKKKDASSDLHIIRDNANQLETRFNQLREDVISKLNECYDYIKSAKKSCRQATEMIATLENRLANISNEEKEWRDIKVKLGTTSIGGRVVLDVEDKKFVTSIETLTREQNTYFTDMLSKPSETERNLDDGSIFIDRNSTIFPYILEYLRTEMIPNNVIKDEELLKAFLIEAKFFRLHSLLDRYVGFFPDSTLLQYEHKKKLNEFYGKMNQQWELIYKASRDGFDSNAFHSRCNNKGPTITIIQSTGNYLFGGYTSVSWTSDGSYKNDSTAFLFTLINPYNIAPTKYLINPTQAGHAVYHHNSYGPTFGSGHDIYVVNGSNGNNSNATGFPSAYIDTTGRASCTFTGGQNFTVSDIEVFKL